jgi:small subunit ribosomal protein S2
MDKGAADEPMIEELPAVETVESDAAPVEHFELLTAPRGAPDDLAKLTGVGPQIVKKLNEHGVFHYWQVGAMTKEEADKLDADLKFNGRIARDNWVEQAKTLIAGA